MRTEIKGRTNIPLGYLIESPTIIQAFSYKKGYLGEYVKSSDITSDKSGKTFCMGDGSRALVLSSD